MSETPREIVVIGAGMVGMCTALWCQTKGMQTTLIDQQEPGQGTSYGNACTIADYANVPVNDPSLFGRLPGLLFGDGPLRINPLHILGNPRWSIDFLRNCSSKNVDKISNALGTLLKEIPAGLDPLIAASNTADLMRESGCLYIYSTKQSFTGAQGSIVRRRNSGVPFEVVDQSAILDMEPAIKGPMYKGLFFPKARQTLNPTHLIEGFFRHFQQLGGSWIKTKVAHVQTDPQSVAIHTNDLKRLSAQKVVIACGAFSRNIKGSGSEQLPLGTERGYHVQYAQQKDLLSRPVGFADQGFYATPMNQGLRLAGVVEIDALNKPANRKCIDYLQRCAEQRFSIDTKADSDWLGYRPTFPDSLPVIGHSPVSRNILLAFGHQHIGLTLGGITGLLISELLNEEQPSIDLTHFKANRFR
ncbi:MAG: glycine/D-amino acid oxidase-like deaminating enzyme [Parasphingorhabdus sp.]|jgi:glycine/D-amino acid oxidase-like deaminating enzyme